MKRLFIFLSIPIVFISALLCLLPKLEMPPCSPILLDQSGEILCTQLTKDEKWRLPIRLDEVPPLYIKMLIAYEDRRFYSHVGVDPIALIRAIGQWIKNGRVISGGSTITMQTVRLLRPRPRTFLYKIEEIFQAIRLELLYSKNEILTMYLTLAPYGGNIEGLRAASIAYFQQDPGQLMPSQMALMVVIPQLPTVLRPHIYPLKAKQFRDKVLLRLKEKGVLTPNQSREAISDPIPSIRYSFPMHALHVMQYLRQNNPTQNVFKTTLNKKKQMALESLLQSEITFFESQQTAAALIIENASRHIIAYVGSADPLSEVKNGYVDMVRAIRSPGSTLKPLIYALAFEENIIHPETLIEDISTDFNGYMPTNFRDVFHGVVTIREALQQSLNIPVVQLLDQLGPGRFVDWLKQYGVTLTFSTKDRLPSLPIALGGVGISLWDLSSLYCALANHGQFLPVTFVPRSQRTNAKELVQSSASWYVTRILEDAPAPHGIVDWFVTDKIPVAFKTGTSYGARDAWCIGYTTGDQAYTVGVWTGRADGTPSPNQLGRKTAAPILHKIFNTILVLKKEFTYPIPPAGVMTLTSAELPESLRWFRNIHSKSKRSSRKTISLTQQKNNLPLRIIYPKNEAIYFLQKKDSTNNTYIPIGLKLQGGNPPYLLLVNGEPVHLNFNQQTALWYPTKIGFFELTILDNEGRSDTVTIRLK